MLTKVCADALCPMMEISLHILDIAENAVAAGASLVEIEIDETDLAYDVTVTDDGVGMSEKELSLAVVAGYTTKPNGSGFGLPKLIEACSDQNGEFSISSPETDGHGSRVRATFPKKERGGAVLGDIVGAVAAAAMNESGCDIVFTHDMHGEYGYIARVGIDTRTLRHAAGDIRHFTPEMVLFIREELTCQYEAARETALL